MSGIGSHTRPGRGASTVWLTPPEIIEALGAFELDPCAAPAPRPWATARRHYDITQGQDGLALPWAGRVWLNPPYGTAETPPWLSRIGDHGIGTALLFARTETRMFRELIWPKASSIMFLFGRPHFYSPQGKRADGNSGGPLALITWGAMDAALLRESGLAGKFILL